MDRQPLIDEMVTFVARHNPNELDKLKLNHVGYTNLLEEGSILGESDDQEELKVRAQVCKVALETVIDTCSSFLPKLKSRLKSSNTVNFAGQVVATVGGASVITSLAADHPTIALGGGILSLIGTLTPIIVNYQKSSLVSNKKLDDDYSLIVGFQIEAKANIRDLNFFVTNGFNQDQVSTIINRSNLLCVEVEKIISLY